MDLQLTEQQLETVKDRVKLPFQFDAQRMYEEIKALDLSDFVYYNVLQLRGPAHLVDTSLPFPPPADDYADGTWTEWMNTKELEQSPYLKSVLDTFSAHTAVNLVRLMRLAPQSEVKEHTDPTLGIHIHKSMVRLTVPIISNDDVSFYLNNELVPMQAGECWYLRLTDPHRVLNNGQTERINMSIDVIPNDWVKSLIINAQD